jgi:hypothetical protein
VKYPDFMDAVVPMASQPTEMSSRNWMMRRLIIDSIRNDPDWKNGDYTTQPRSAKFASVFYGIDTAGGTLAYQKLAPTRAAADELLNGRLESVFVADANDALYQWDSSRDYNPAPELERIRAAVLAIESADDERNPPEQGSWNGSSNGSKMRGFTSSPRVKRLADIRLQALPSFGSRTCRPFSRRHRSVACRRAESGRASPTSPDITTATLGSKT